MEKCPRCNLQVTELHRVDPEFAAQLQVIGEMVSDAICVACTSELRKTLSQSRGGVLLAQERAKESYRLALVCVSCAAAAALLRGLLCLSRER